jgi:hypothetical protein
MGEGERQGKEGILYIAVVLLAFEVEHFIFGSIKGSIVFHIQAIISVSLTIVTKVAVLLIFSVHKQNIMTSKKF